MPYRDVTLPDGRVVKARISDKAIASWWRHRKMSLGQGNPDRPPDVDTRTQRVWIVRPSEVPEGQRAIDNNRERTNLMDDGDFSCYVVTARAHHMVQKLLVSWRDGAYHLDVKHDRISDGSTAILMTATATHEEVQDLINRTLEAFWIAQVVAAAAFGEEPEPWLETTYEEIEETEREMDLAMQESAAEFGRTTADSFHR